MREAFTNIVNLVRNRCVFVLAGICLVLFSACQYESLSEEEAIILNRYLASEEFVNSANAINNMSNAITHDYSFA